MPTTKPDGETGWTDQYPHKSGAGDEYYFVRRKDGRDVVIMGFSMGKAWLNGVSYDPSELRSHLFLGPLSPSDFEQLIRLRKQIEEAQDVIEGLLEFSDNVIEAFEIRPLPAHRACFNRARALIEALDEKDYCGCCGTFCDYSSLDEPWCQRCKSHVGPRHLQPHERTYLAINNVDCPFQENANVNSTT